MSERQSLQDRICTRFRMSKRAFQTRGKFREPNDDTRADIIVKILVNARNILIKAFSEVI